MNTQMIPAESPCIYVDEPSEFRAFAEKTDENMRYFADEAAKQLARKHQACREARKQRRRIIRNCKLILLGIVASGCAIAAVLIWRASYPALAIFPAALAVISLAKGVKL